jgi:hypothetical protein
MSVWQQLEEFFNGLCTPTEEPQFGDPPTSIVPRQFRKKALMVMYQFVRAHGKELNDELSEFPPYSTQVRDAPPPPTHPTQSPTELTAPVRARRNRWLGWCTSPETSACGTW